VPVCYDAHWIGYKLGSGTGATAGQAAAKLYSLQGNIQGDAPNKYWYGSGVAGNFMSTPSATANQIVGDIEIIVKVLVMDTSLMSPAYNYLIIKGTTASTGVEDYSFFIEKSTGKLGFASSSIGGYYSSVTLNSIISSGTIAFLKVNRISSTGVIKFFTSLDGVTYTQLGSNVSSSSGALANAGTFLSIGQLSANNSYVLQGKIYRATISNSIGGAHVVDFNPATYNAATSQTAWTSSTGEVWTINTGTAATGYKGVLVDRTIMQADGIDDKLINITASVNQPNTNYLSFKSIQTSVATQWMVDGYGSTTRQIISKQNATTIRTFAGSFANSTTSNLDKLMLISAIYNSATSSAYKNNVLIGSGLNVGTQNLGGVVLFGDATTTFAQGIINTFLSTTDNTKLTETYNLIRSLNNNSF
jgi:hypothetical protein